MPSSPNLTARSDDYGRSGATTMMSSRITVEDLRDALESLRASCTRLRAAATEYHATKVILLDLIADLRDHDKNCVDCGAMTAMADEAEARLKGLNDE